MLTAAMAVVIALLVVVAALLHAASRARARALADDVRAKVEPYLRRKAAESGMPASAPTWTSRSQPEEIVAYSTSLARRLLDRDRYGPGGRADSGAAELARTEPLDASPPGVTVDTSDLRRGPR